MQPLGQHGLHSLGDWPLLHGGLLREAQLGYRIWGSPNAARDNFVVLPTFYTGAHDDYAPLIGAGRALDPERFCIVAIDLFGNGVSTSPSNAHFNQRGNGFPQVAIEDNVRAQHRFLSEALGMREVALVAGWSMGGIQAYRWAADYPEQVRRLLPWCTAGRCSAHNQVFIEGVRAALVESTDWQEGRFEQPPARGLRAFARVYCGWAYSQGWFRRGGYRDLGFESVEALLADWEADHLRWDAHDLLAKLTTWQDADLGRGHGGFELALKRIEANTILLPSRSDLYFTPEDNAFEAQHISRCQLRIAETDTGHAGGGPGRDPVFATVLEAALHDLLNDGRKAP